MTKNRPGTLGEVLVTGGLGYIGSHVCVALINQGYGVTILNRFSNGNLATLGHIEQIAGARPAFIRGDLQDENLLDRVFCDNAFQAVIHMAGLKGIARSVESPAAYYAANVCGTVALVSAMQSNNVRTLVFSSSAAVYGNPHAVPIREDFPCAAMNPYGRTKIVIEEMLQDLHRSDPRWRVACVRSFNPVGAHPSGLIGENPRGIPNNLMPFITQVAIGKRDRLCIYGNGYPTWDGTVVRDYIHVMDLAEGYVAALSHIVEHKGLTTANLGGGRGYSVLEVIQNFERVTGQPVPYKIGPRRQGDIAECWADPSLAESLFSWKAKRSLDDMCRDSWRWQQHLLQEETTNL